MDIIEIKEHLKNISYIYTSNEEFRKVLKSPIITIEEKLEIIKEIFPEISHSEFLEFIKTLLENDDIDQIEDIYEKYDNYCNELNKELNIKIVVADSIDNLQIEKITEKYKKIYQANKINYTIEKDESILGGVKVIINNTIYDTSLKSQLKGMF